MDSEPDRRGLTLLEGALALGMSESALRKRLQRGKAPPGSRAYKQDGEWRIDLGVYAGEPGRVDTSPRIGATAAEAGSQPGVPSPPDGETTRHNDTPLIDALRAQVHHLEDDITDLRLQILARERSESELRQLLGREQEGNVELRRILAQALGIRKDPPDPFLLPEPAAADPPPPGRQKGWLRRQWGRLLHGEP